MAPSDPDNPEQRARCQIDMMLAVAGWAVQDQKDINLAAAPGVALASDEAQICAYSSKAPKPLQIQLSLLLTMPRFTFGVRASQ